MTLWRARRIAGRWALRVIIATSAALSDGCIHVPPVASAQACPTVPHSAEEVVDSQWRDCEQTCSPRRAQKIVIDEGGATCVCTWGRHGT